MNALRGTTTMSCQERVVVGPLRLGPVSDPLRSSRARLPERSCPGSRSRERPSWPALLSPPAALVAARAAAFFRGRSRRLPPPFFACPVAAQPTKASDKERLMASRFMIPRCLGVGKSEGAKT